MCSYWNKDMMVAIVSAFELRWPIGMWPWCPWPYCPTPGLHTNRTGVQTSPSRPWASFIWISCHCPRWPLSRYDQRFYNERKTLFHHHLYILFVSAQVPKSKTISLHTEHVNLLYHKAIMKKLILWDYLSDNWFQSVDIGDQIKGCLSTAINRVV